MASPALQPLAARDWEEGKVSNSRLQLFRSEHPVELTRMLQSLTSRGFLDQIGQKRGSSYRLPRWATPLAADTLPQPSWEIDSRLLEIAKPARDKKKLVPALTRTIIRQLCEGQYLRAEQLGELMDRSKEKLQMNFLGPMVQNGELTLRYPGQPTHPEQAYRTNPDWRES